MKDTPYEFRYIDPEAPTAIVRFCHDLEDGWYSIKFPDGRYTERNWWHDIISEAIGYKLIWNEACPTHYKPDFPEGLVITKEYSDSVQPKPIKDASYPYYRCKC